MSFKTIFLVLTASPIILHKVEIYQMLRLCLVKYNKSLCGAVKGSRNMCLFNAAIPEKNMTFREKLSVNICGRIAQTPVVAGKGAIIIPMITRYAGGELYVKHTVFAPLSTLKNVSADRLIEGDRIHVSGVIRYLDFQNSEGRPKQHGQILSSSVFLCEQDENPSNDINQVTLFGVVNNKKLTENITFVTVNTKFFDPKVQNINTQTHELVIKDDEALREQASRMWRGLGISIHGSLDTRTTRTKDGKWNSTCRIHVQKMIEHAYLQ